MDITLQPEVKLPPRYWALGVIALLVVIVPGVPWLVRIPVGVFLAVLSGTYRNSIISGDKFRSQLYVAYIPISIQKCNLPGVVYVETKYNSGVPRMPSFLMIGPLKVVFELISDILIPVLGGAYEIWLITAKDREIAAWQGLNQKDFDENVALLSARSGAEIRGRSK